MGCLILCGVLCPAVVYTFFAVITLFITPNYSDNIMLSTQCPLLLNTCRVSAVEVTLFMLYMCFVEPSHTRTCNLKPWTKCGWIRWSIMLVCSCITISIGGVNVTGISDVCMQIVPNLCFALYWWSLLTSAYICALMLGFACLQTSTDDNENEERLTMQMLWSDVY